MEKVDLSRLLEDLVYALTSRTSRTGMASFNTGGPDWARGVLGASAAAAFSSAQF